MSLGNVNLNDFTSDLSREVAKVLDAKTQGIFSGRKVVQILSESKVLETSQGTTKEEFIAKIFETSVNSIRGQEISTLPSDSFSEACSHFSSEELDNRLKAYDEIIRHLEKSGNKSGINKKIDGILKEQKERLENLKKFGIPSPIKQEESKPPKENSGMSPAEIEEHLGTLAYLTDTYLDLAKELLEMKNLTNTDPKTEAALFAFSTENDQIHVLQQKLSFVEGSEAKNLILLSKALHKLEDAPFLEKYRSFEAERSFLENAISSESSASVEIYMKKLYQNCDTMEKMVEQYPIEKVQGQLKTEDQKLCFYCIAKFQDEIQDLAAQMSQGNIFSPTINSEQLLKLSKLAEKLDPLKKHLKNETKPIIPSKCETVSLEDAQKLHKKALQLLENPKIDAETATTIQELLWKSALGYVQNDKYEESRECLSLASKHTPKIEEMIPTDLKARLQASPQHGIHLSGWGTSYNKDHSVHLTQCRIDKVSILKMDFALNGHGVLGANAVRKTLDFPDSRQLMKMLPPDFCSSIKISRRESHQYLEYKSGSFDTQAEGYKMPQTPQTVIEFVGVGKIYIGDCPEIKCIHNMIQIEAVALDPIEKTLANMQVMLSALGLPPVMVSSRTKDQQIRALLDVFRAYYPRDAALIERDGNTFQLSPADLQSRIVHLKPEMQAFYDEYLDQKLLPKRQVEHIPGKLATGVNLSDEMRKKGALGLMIGMEGSIEVKAKRLSILLKPRANGGTGMISSQLRFLNGIIVAGQSSYSDHKEGGATGVFTRLITKELAARTKIDDIAFHGSIQFLIDLKAADAPNSYGFESDCYGTRSSGNYFSRFSLIELTEALQKPTSEMFGKPSDIKKYGTANEVVIRDSIGPELIKGIVVGSAEDKETVIKQLKADGMLELKNSVWYIGMTPIDDFIKVGKQFTETMFT
jgi:hypothetical protein